LFPQLSPLLPACLLLDYFSPRACSPAARHPFYYLFSFSCGSDPGQPLESEVAASSPRFPGGAFRGLLVIFLPFPLFLVLLMLLLFLFHSPARMVFPSPSVPVRQHFVRVAPSSPIPLRPPPPYPFCPRPSRPLPSRAMHQGF